MADDISRQHGNWSQLRTLVLRLLQAHEETLDDHEHRLGIGATVDVELQKDLNRCLEEIFGDASTDSLRTAIRLVQAEQAGMHKAIEGAHSKANAAHAKSNSNGEKIVKLQACCDELKGAVKELKGAKTPDGIGKASNSMVMGLIAIISTLVTALAEVLKHFITGGW